MRWIYYSVSFLLFAVVCYLAYLIAVPLVGGLIMAFLLYPAVQFLEKRQCGNTLAVSLVMLGALVLVFLSSALLMPSLIEQIEGMVNRKDDMVLSATQIMNGLDSWLASHWGTSGRDQVHGLVLDKGRHLLASLGEQVPQMAMGLLSLLGNLMLSPVIAFFLLLEGGDVYRSVLKVVPQKSFELVARLLQQGGKLMGAYLRGQVFDCLIVGVLLWMGMAILGVKGALAIGLLSGVLNAVPYVGPLIGLALCYLSFFADPSAAYPWWSLAVVFVLVMKLDGYLIYPQTVGRSLRLNAFVVMLSLMAGGALAGIVGMVVASPLVALAMESQRIFRKTLVGYKEI